MSFSVRRRSAPAPLPLYSRASPASALLSLRAFKQGSSHRVKGKRELSRAGSQRRRGDRRLLPLGMAAASGRKAKGGSKTRRISVLHAIRHSSSLSDKIFLTTS